METNYVFRTISGYPASAQLGNNNLTFNSMKYLNSAYLFTTDYPVIWVDWRELATPKIFTPSILYPAIADNVPIVGLRVFHLIEFLLRSGIVRSLQDIHLIGHSLGAHICGRAGQLMFMRHGVKVGRITGTNISAVTISLES